MIFPFITSISIFFFKIPIIKYESELLKSTAFRPTSTSIYETTCKEFLIFNWFVHWIDRLGSCLGVIATTTAQKP